ncbi:hypothetical protein [Stakelama tenebrarum]|uniref:AcrB/AcrD/AcrF family protein n=1 Tax=Stakelama tenebrarum TaxID=2711215 RepID=A0A6G6Y9B9_9SPHN|nr:hypothetical protein [Sphingosinithalassobacter tenebrarum]QIG81441.1 hypothetical protein G5C33_17710 [Sphingosinithalassobacter tenebrarum]
METRAHRIEWRDLAVACALACVLTLAWAARDWSALSALALPDTDDGMRLQQIRDWLGGQAFGDLMQYRLGPDGLIMHWSRIPDLVPAAIIALLTPLIGAHDAELTAVILWPAMLFAGALMLIGGIARALETQPAVAQVIAALAYPATTLFLPGRIDHHGLQILLLLIVALMLVRPMSWRSAATAGLATAVSLAIGMETAPLLAAAAAVLVLQWIAGARGAQARLGAWSVTLTLGFAAGAALLRTNGWTYPSCDGFTETLWRAAQGAAIVPLLLALIGFIVPDSRSRAACAILGGLAALAFVHLTAPICLSPYAGLDSMLNDIWLSNVAEAQPLFETDLTTAIGYAGIMVAGIGTSAWFARRDARWLSLLALQIASLALACIQLRGAYAGAILAAPALAALVAAARRRGTLRLILAWFASAGIAYPAMATALTSRPVSEPVREAPNGCSLDGAIDALRDLPPSRILAPVDLSARALPATEHRFLAGPYHRNEAGNRALYRILTSKPLAGRAQFAALDISYLAYCEGSFGEVDARADRDSLLALLRHDAPPQWLQPVSPPGAPLIILAVKQPE